MTNTETTRVTLSVSSLLDRFLRPPPHDHDEADLYLSVSSLLDRFLRLLAFCRLLADYFAFSILAVGSFPQTLSSLCAMSPQRILSVSSLLDRFLRPLGDGYSSTSLDLSVSSLLDRFLRRHQRHHPFEPLETFSILAVGSFPQTHRPPQGALVALDFQYPRCWIVSSDRSPPAAQIRWCSTFSILAVGSFPQTNHHQLSYLLSHVFQYPRCWIVSSDLVLCIRHLSYCFFQYPRCWIVSSDSGVGEKGATGIGLSVSSLLDRFLRLTHAYFLEQYNTPFSILAVGSFPQTYRVC